jgi:dimethylargininase
MLTALLRLTGPELARCRLEFRRREPVDAARAAAQQRDYARALEAAGVRVAFLPPLDDLPDAAFVEDPAVVLDEVAVITRMGAAGRRAEQASLAAALAAHRPLRTIEAPATLEGGDVLHVERRLIVGLSPRTNRAGAQQLAAIAGEFGYTVETVAVRGCLHLKTACTHAGGNLLVVKPAWIDADALDGFELLPVAAAEPWGANTLAVNGTVLVAASAPATRALLKARGLRTAAVDISEFEKAEAGLTCLSLVFHSTA